MKTGIVYVVFGDNCNKVAAHCIAYSRKFTKLPITIIRNNCSPYDKWGSIQKIDCKICDIETAQNREVKTNLIDYSPYDFTIYMDADSIVQSSEFDAEVAKMVEADPDLILNHFCTYPYPDGNFQNIYLRALKKFDCIMPLKVYNGAFIGFKKNDKVREFFSVWNKMWEEFGAQREMPPLACAVSKVDGLSVYTLPDNFFSPDSKNDNAVVQHNYNGDFWEKIDCEPTELSISHCEVGDYGFTKI